MTYDCFAKYYDVLTGNIDYRKRASYFDRLIKKYKRTDNDILLDLCCGTGSLSEEFSKLGYDVIAVDRSPEMLDLAIEKKFEKDLPIQYLCQDARDLDMFGTIGITVCALDSINHLDSLADVKKVFERVSLFAEPGGIFIFDMNSVYKHSSVLKNNCFVYETEEVYCVWQNEYTGGEEHKVDISLDFFEPSEKGGYTRSSEYFSERAYSIESIIRVLEEVGLEPLAVFEGDTENSPADDSERIVFVAGKSAF